jgi:hypothetical protein
MPTGSSINTIRQNRNLSDADIASSFDPNMKRTYIYPLSLALSLAMTACAIAPNVEANRTALAGIKRVAIVDLKLPNAAMVQNFGLAMGFGAIGGAAQGGSNADKSKTFSASIANHVPSLNDALVAAVVSGLTQEGYEVTVIGDQKPNPSSDRKIWDVSKIHTDADAILVVWAPLCGYVSPPQVMHYEPQIMIRAQLTVTKNQEHLYLKTFFVGYKAASISAECVPATGGNRYKSFEDLNLHASDAADTLIACERIGAQKISRDLTGH